MKISASPLGLLLISIFLILPSPGNADCPPEYEEVDGWCYLSHCPKLSWHDAHDYCANANGTLVIINSLKEGASLLEWLKEKGITEPFWTGLVGVGKAARKKRDLSHYQCVLKGNEDFECFRYKFNFAFSSASICIFVHS